MAFGRRAVRCAKGHVGMNQITRSLEGRSIPLRLIRDYTAPFHGGSRLRSRLVPAGSASRWRRPFGGSPDLPGRELRRIAGGKGLPACAVDTRSPRLRRPSCNGSRSPGRPPISRRTTMRRLARTCRSFGLIPIAESDPGPPVTLLTPAAMLHAANGRGAEGGLISVQVYCALHYASGDDVPMFPATGSVLARVIARSA